MSNADDELFQLFEEDFSYEPELDGEQLDVELDFEEMECDPPLPDYPVCIPAGTPEKLAIFRARFEAGQAIFHPEDTVDLD